MSLCKAAVKISSACRSRSAGGLVTFNNGLMSHCKEPHKVHEQPVSAVSLRTGTLTRGALSGEMGFCIWVTRSGQPLCSKMLMPAHDPLQSGRRGAHLVRLFKGSLVAILRDADTSETYQAQNRC